MPRALALLLLAIFFAGCLGGPDDAVAPITPAEGIVPALGVPDLAPVFTLPRLVDERRAGGEPVIAITQAGTILISGHPGYTHYRPQPGAVPPTSAELVVPTQLQSYLWRSTDDGATFETVTLLPVDDAPNAGPRGIGQGVSDPDFTIMPGGRIYLTDLEGLVEASVSWSDDDGATWLMGNNAASGGPIDRQWLASHGEYVYFTGNFFTDSRVLRSTDGLVWERLGDKVCNGDLVANPLNGHLVAGCDDGLTRSADGGATWDQVRFEVEGSAPAIAEPAIDAAGTIYRAVDPDYTELRVFYTQDEGDAWQNFSIKPFFPELADGTWAWPWVSAGSEGRIAVTFYGSSTPAAYDVPSAEWFLYTALITDATSPAPQVYPVKVTPEPIHVGGMCQQGTQCQATTAIDPTMDRRLGDFFETTIDPRGRLHIAYTNTAERSDDTIGHAAYVRQDGGLPLVVGTVDPRFPTQG